MVWYSSLYLLLSRVLSFSQKPSNMCISVSCDLFLNTLLEEVGPGKASSEHVLFIR